MVDMMSLEEMARQELKKLESENRLWKEHRLESPASNWSVVDGTKQLMLCTNDYLGLANNEEIKKASISTTEAYGVGSGAVRVISGTMSIHKQLEEELAAFKRRPASITFQSGYVTNFGVLSTLLGEEDLVLSDELNHGSIIDGIRMSRSEKVVYKHNDMDSLAEALERAKPKGKMLIVTDAVFSMEGDIAPLPGIAKLAKKYGAITYVDDAHGDGVLGENGRGAVNHFGLEGKIDIEMGTFSKAFGSVGGYIAAGENFCEMLRNKVRAFLLSGSHPPSVAAANLESIRYVQKNPKLLKILWSNTRYFKKGLRSLGFDTGKSETPITPIMIGDSGAAQKMADELFKEGVFVIPIVFPMVPKGAARIRTIVNARHTESDLDFALGKLEKVGKRLHII